LAIHECDAEDASLAADLDVEQVQWPAVGTEFLGFQLLRELGRGAFAHVYLARQPALGNRLVVVKVAQYGSGEAETLGRLGHRNIVPVYSVSEDPATHVTAVCMPYLGSATLLDVLDVGFAEDRPPERARFIQNIAIQEALPQVVPDIYSGPDACLQHGTCRWRRPPGRPTGGGLAAYAPGRDLPPRSETVQCTAHTVRLPDVDGLQSLE
jgi:hypothetical protein